MKGKVFLIGAGPGDESLITLKGLNCLTESNVVVYDYLVNKELLKYAKKDAEIIYVGKKASQHTLKQEEINDLLVEKALAGNTISRLKGGDPYIFGRGGEEALALKQNNILFEIVPGVTAATAASAYAGFPLTHRDFTSSVAFITGHEKFKKEESALHWKNLAQGIGTLVFYMGINNLPNITSKLIKNGLDPHTPACLIRWGTYNYQKTLVSTVENIYKDAQNADFTPPALIIIGKVVSLRKDLRWFDNRPLFNKKIIVTRSRTQASGLVKKLKFSGADVIELPTIAIKPVTDLELLDKNIKKLEQFNWLIFTSHNAVEYFFNRVYELGYDSRKLAGLKIGVIGKETGTTLFKYGVRYDFSPEQFTSEAFVAGIKKNNIDFNNQNILIPGSDIARDIIPDALSEMGADVTRISTYSTIVPEYDKDYFNSIFDDHIDLITFTSSSTVNNFVKLINKFDKSQLLGKIKGVSIGPVTTETAKNNNINILKEAKEHTIDGLVTTINNIFKEQK